MLKLKVMYACVGVCVLRVYTWYIRSGMLHMLMSSIPKYLVKHKLLLAYFFLPLESAKLSLAYSNSKSEECENSQRIESSWEVLLKIRKWVSFHFSGKRNSCFSMAQQLDFSSECHSRQTLPCGSSAAAQDNTKRCHHIVLSWPIPFQQVLIPRGT